jgi:hypothetical protein
MTGTMVSWFADPILRPLNNSVALAVCKIDPRASFSQEPLMLKITKKFVSHAGHSGCPPGSSIMVIRSRSSRVHLLLAFWGSTEICAVNALCKSRCFPKVGIHRQLSSGEKTLHAPQPQPGIDDDSVLCQIPQRSDFVDGELAS